MKRVLKLAVLGGAVAYLSDAGRRRSLLERVSGLFRGGRRRVSDAGQSVDGSAQGVAHRHDEAKDVDDVTLARKVETEIFREPQAPKGSVDVNVQDGIVQLRGEVERPDLIDDLVARTRSVEGVKDVENLLHTPGTPAPMHQ